VVPVSGWIDPYWIDLHEASLLLEAGELEPVAAFLERYGDTVADRADPRDAAWVWAVRLGMAARLGSLEETRAALGGYLAVPAGKSRSWRHGTPGLHGLIAALRAGFPPAEVRPFLDAVDRDGGADGAAPGRWSPSRAGRRHLEAALLEAGGDPAAALDAYLEVLAHADVYRAAYRLADCHQGAARCLLAQGDEPGALHHARQAGRLLERWPGWRRDEAAALLADGLSNGEIARRLYISTKTASVHVSNILAKLDMTSRTEVATWAVRTGLVPPEVR
jgi:DNA-binding CsgD family transcriptional regulator